MFQTISFALRSNAQEKINVISDKASQHDESADFSDLFLLADERKKIQHKHGGKCDERIDKIPLQRERKRIYERRNAGYQQNIKNIAADDERRTDWGDF